MLVVMLVGCGEKDEDIPEEATTVSAPVTVAVDTSELRGCGEITVFNGTDFIHESSVVDYVGGDPAHLDPYHDVYGIYTILRQGTGDVINKAVLTDGTIVSLDTNYKLLPREQHSFILNGEAKDERKMVFTLQLDGTYALSIPSAHIVTSNVTDAWTAYDTVYWLVHDTVYKLDWWDEEAQPEVYYEGAYGVSHEADEAEGALVPLDKANMQAYGRSDIYSPYGDKLNRR